MALKTMYPPQANSPATYLTEAVAADATSIKVNSASVLPALPTLLVLGSEEKAAECVLATSKSGNTITVERAVEGTAKAWPAGTSVARLFTAEDLKAVQENLRIVEQGKMTPADIYRTESDGTIWLQKNYRASDGTVSTLTTRCRTAFLPTGVKAVTPAPGMKVAVYAWNSSDVYQGVWSGSAWSKNSADVTFFQAPIMFARFGAGYKFKVVAAYTDDRDIPTLADAQAAGALIGLSYGPDTTFTASGAAADAAAVGETFAAALSNKGTLTNTDDLDTLTKPGLYSFQYTSASHPMNIPEGLNTLYNRLLVIKSASDSYFYGSWQIIITGNSSGPHLYFRAYYYSQSVWTDWKEAADTASIPEVDALLSTPGAAADAAAVGSAVSTLTEAAIETIDTSDFGWEEGGFDSEGYQNRFQTIRIKLTDAVGRRAFYVKAGSTVVVGTGYKFGVAQYSRYASTTDFDLIGIRSISDGGGSFTVPQDCWIKVALGTTNDAVLWTKSGSTVTLTSAGEAALAAVELNLIGATAMDKIAVLEEAIETGGGAATYPLNGSVAINALEYHKKWDGMVDEGFCSRSTAQYMSFDTEHHFPLYVYHISNYKKYMATDYSVKNYGDGQPWLPVRPKVLLVSGVHGSEKGAPNFLHDFISSMRRNANSAELLAKYDWTIVPLASPWGYSHSFVTNGGVVYYGQAWRPSSYPNLVENTAENGYNSGSRYVSNNWDSYTRGVDPNRDFDDVAGFEAEETQFIRDNVLTQETFDVVIDMHQRAEDTDKQYSFVCFKGDGLTDSQMQPLYQTVVEAGAATDVAMAAKYGLDAGVQYSYPWAYGTLLSFSNYAAGKSRNGHGFIDELFTPARYAMTIETSPVCQDYSGSTQWHNPIANEYGNTFIHNFLTKFLGKLEL